MKDRDPHLEMRKRCFNVAESLEHLPDSERFRAAAVLAASVELGPDPYLIATRLRFPSAEVKRFARRLRAAGIWKAKTVYCEWFDPETGPVAFALDTLVATGELRRWEP